MLKHVAGQLQRYILLPNKSRCVYTDLNFYIYANETQRNVTCTNYLDLYFRV